MQTFTSAISEYLLKKHSSLKDVTLVFPGRRAGLFLLRELTAQSNTALFAPKIITLDQLASDMTGLSQGDTLPMLYTLYDKYKLFTGSQKTFDDFIFHGNTLLGDFNECDNELIDIEKLYANISDIKEIDERYSDNILYAKEFILGFWQMFIGNSNFEMQKGFGNLWQKLPLVYEEFTKELTEKGIGYGGFIMRHAATRENLTEEYLQNNNAEHIYFAGFNALTRAEKALFNNFKKSGKASFLWDHDEYYLKDQNQEAGTFMRDNLQRFPMPQDFVNENKPLFNQYQNKKKIHIIPVPQITDQARYLEKLAADGILTDKTAIVLADEKMLVPVIHALPGNISANVTMGYEIRYTASFALLESLITLYKNSRRSKNGQFFRSSDASRVLLHFFFRKQIKEVRNIHKDLLGNRTYVKETEIEVPGVLQNIFSFKGEPVVLIEFLEGILMSVYSVVEELSDFSSKKTELQAIFEMHGQLKKLQNVISENDTEIKQFSTIASLIKRAVSLLTISFRGEPLTGLQIMGFLETRAIDFKNVIILSANEGMLPKTSSSGSFIPMTLRKGFKMRTPSYDEAIFAYNFYRLIQRAENVWITWCTGQGITEKAEMSRYLLQMTYDKTHQLEIASIDNKPVITPRQTISVEKDSNILALLDVYKNGTKRMSSSSINTYIDCPLRFYFSYVAGMRDYDEAIEEDMDNRVIGSLFHKAAEFLYNSKLKMNEIVTTDILKTIKEKDYDDAISSAFKDVLNYKEKNYSDYLSGTEWLYDEIIRRYLKALVKWEVSNCPFVYLGHEIEDQAPFGDKGIIFYGRIDRVDEKDGIVVISDYKASDLTGVKVFAGNGFAEGAKRRNYVFQLYFYRYILSKKYNKPIKTRLISVNKLISADSCVFENDPAIPDEMKSFTEELEKVLDELFSPEQPFVQAERVEACKYCNYKSICNRQEPQEF